MKRLLLFTAMATLLVACGNDIPQNFWEADELPNICPDYTNVTVPINIAPDLPNRRSCRRCGGEALGGRGRGHLQRTGDYARCR